jgi:hypothetical protein
VELLLGGALVEAEQRVRFLLEAIQCAVLGIADEALHGQKVQLVPGETSRHVVGQGVRFHEVADDLGQAAFLKVHSASRMPPPMTGRPTLHPPRRSDR